MLADIMGKNPDRGPAWLLVLSLLLLVFSAAGAVAAEFLFATGAILFPILLIHWCLSRRIGGRTAGQVCGLVLVLMAGSFAGVRLLSSGQVDWGDLPAAALLLLLGFWLLPGTILSITYVVTFRAFHRGDRIGEEQGSADGS